MFNLQLMLAVNIIFDKFHDNCHKKFYVQGTFPEYRKSGNPLPKFYLISKDWTDSTNTKLT